MNGAVFHHDGPESDAESDILPAFALNHMTDSHLMEALLSKQTQYTPHLRDPPLRTKRNSCFKSTGPLSIESIAW